MARQREGSETVRTAGGQPALFNVLRTGHKKSDEEFTTLAEVYGPTRGLRLVHSSAPNTPEVRAERQLSFDWSASAQGRVIAMISPRSAPYLDYGIYEIFRFVPEARKAAYAIEEAGIYLIGQLVQFSPDDLLLMRGVTDEAVTAILGDLAKYGLSLGMYVPQWNREAEMSLALQ